MLSTVTVTIETEDGEREILVSPFLLQSKVPPDIKSGKISVLYFYDQLWDDDYWIMVDKEFLPEKFKTNDHIINCGQDFGKSYLGSLQIDFDTKFCGEWAGEPGKLTDLEVKVLVESFFQLKTRQVVIFSPTRPSDFNLDRM